MTNLTMGHRARPAAEFLDQRVEKLIVHKAKAILANSPCRLMYSENKHLKTKSHWERLERLVPLY